MTEAPPPQDRTKSTPIIDAAIQAQCQGLPTGFGQSNCSYVDQGYGTCHLSSSPFCRTARPRAIAILRVACSKEPPAAWIETMAEAIACNGKVSGAERSYPRWMLFSEATRCSYRVDAVEVYRSNPLYQELWGEP